MKKLIPTMLGAAFACALSINALADHNTPESVDSRTAPIGKLNISSEETATTAAAGPRDGETVYNLACMACHASGVAGAPKTGDPAAWAPRIAKGVDALLDHAINGFQGEAGMMPPRGGNPTLTDEEVSGAVEFILAQSQ